MKKNKFPLSLPAFHFDNRTCAQLFAIWLSALTFIAILLTCSPSIPAIFIMILFFWLGTGPNDTQKKQQKQQRQYNDDLLDDDWSE